MQAYYGIGPGRASYAAVCWLRTAPRSAPVFLPSYPGCGCQWEMPGRLWHPRLPQVLQKSMQHDIAQAYFNEPVDAEVLGIPEYRGIITVS